VEVLGADEYFNYIQKYGIVQPEEVEERIDEDQPKKEWDDFRTEQNQSLMDDDALDLLS
jgi:hypothetical protein